jgi:predicted esterase
MQSPLVAAILLATAAGDPGPALSRQLERFFAADSVRGSQKQIEKIVALAPSFETIYDRLGPGRHYGADVARGVVERSRRNRDGTRHRYLVIVPESYDPGQRYPVRVYLHGGVDRPEPEGAEYWWPEPERLLREDRIVIVPASWVASKWWQASQVENLSAILREVKRRYNVDENRVSVVGISDGGTGVWYLAFRDPTPWASFLALNGSPYVLANPGVGAEGRFLVPNLNQRSFLVFNGSDDPLYPADQQRSLMELFRKVGATVVFHVIEGGKHDVSWWPEQRETIDAFVASHPRDPLPDEVFWAVERADRHNRAFWVLVDELAPRVEGETPMAALGVPPEHAGGVAVRRQGNTIDVMGLGVRRYRLLLSPEELDLDAEIVVTTNGTELFRGIVPRSLETLLEWAARDMDRTMLFAAELPIEVPPTLQRPPWMATAPDAPGK